MLVGSYGLCLATYAGAVSVSVCRNTGLLVGVLTGSCVPVVVVVVGPLGSIGMLVGSYGLCLATYAGAVSVSVCRNTGLLVGVLTGSCVPVVVVVIGPLGREAMYVLLFLIGVENTPDGVLDLMVSIGHAEVDVITYYVSDGCLNVVKGARGKSAYKQHYHKDKC